MDGSRHHRPRLVGRTSGALVVVGDHHTVNGFGGMGRPPADDVGSEPVLVKDIPDRFDFPRGVGDGTDAACVGVWLGKSIDTVLKRTDARADGSLEHRREDGVERGEVTHDAVVNETFEVWHFPCVEEWIDGFPVSGVPTDEQDFLPPVCVVFFHSKFLPNVSST